MHVRYVGAAALDALLNPDKPSPFEGKGKAVFDSASGASPRQKARSIVVLDAAGAYLSQDMALKAVAALQEWAETDNLDSGEGLGDRLFALFVGIVDADKDGEISEDEAELLALASESAWDYLAGKGVPEDDISALVQDFDNEAAARVQELLIDRLPDGDGAMADMDAFAFGDGADESALDAVYRMETVVRDGKKVRIKKRVSGTVRLSAKQKLAIRKMQAKSHSSAANAQRAKSMRVARQ